MIFIFFLIKRKIFSKVFFELNGLLWSVGTKTGASSLYMRVVKRFLENNLEDYANLISTSLMNRGLCLSLEFSRAVFSIHKTNFGFRWDMVSRQKFHLHLLWFLIFQIFMITMIHMVEEYFLRPPKFWIAMLENCSGHWYLSCWFLSILFLPFFVFMYKGNDSSIC